MIVTCEVCISCVTCNTCVSTSYMVDYTDGWRVSGGSWSRGRKHGVMVMNVFTSGSSRLVFFRHVCVCV